MPSTLVSVIIAVYNGCDTIVDCLNSVVKQTCLTQSGQVNVEICLHDDCSTDSTRDIVRDWWHTVGAKTNVDVNLHVSATSQKNPKGPGFGRNAAIVNSKGDYICILDADDWMYPTRIEHQLELAKRLNDTNVLLGAKHIRTPVDSTPRYSKWVNELSHEELVTQCFRECTLIQPTWFFHRHLYQKVGRYPETREEAFSVAESGIALSFENLFDAGTAYHVALDATEESDRLQRPSVDSSPNCTDYIPEDLVFFLQHVTVGGKLGRVDEPLVSYTYSEQSCSYKIDRRFLIRLRAKFLERYILSQWDEFSIWSVGRDGKTFFNALSARTRSKVKSFIDINPKKVGTCYHNASTKETIPIRSMDESRKNFVTCVALDRTGGVFESNLTRFVKEHSLAPFTDYVVFN